MKLKPDSFTIQLKSGRRITLTAEPYFQAIDSGSDDFQFFAISALRMNAANPESFLRQLVVDQDSELPPVCVADILEGRSQWTLDEAEQFRDVLAQDSEFSCWLHATREDLETSIQNSSVFESNLVQNDFDISNPNPDMLLRAAVLKAALKPDAMQILRGRFSNRNPSPTTEITSESKTDC